MFEVDFKILNQKATPAIYADTLALRPAASFAGRLFVATDSPYGVFRDTGAAWVQVAAGTGGSGSTGINGLNGTTNIGLGGTLANNTTILGATNNILFRNNNNFTIDQSNDIDIKSFFSSSVSYGRLNLTTLKTDLFFGDNTTYTNINLTSGRIKTNYGAGEIGLDLYFGNGIYTIGDFGFTAKKTQIRVDDLNTKIYFTTGASTSNITPDLLVAENVSSSIRSIKLGDFSNFNKSMSFIIDDGNSSIYTNTALGLTSGISINNNGASLGNKNSSGYLFLLCDYTNNIISTYNSFSTDTGLKLNFQNKIYTFGGFNANGNIIEINDDTAFNTIKFETSNLIFNGAALESGTSGGNSGQHLVITLNGNQYKIKLENP